MESGTQAAGSDRPTPLVEQVFSHGRAICLMSPGTPADSATQLTGTLCIRSSSHFGEVYSLEVSEEVVAAFGLSQNSVHWLHWSVLSVTDVGQDMQDCHIFALSRAVKWFDGSEVGQFTLRGTDNGGPQSPTLRGLLQTSLLVHRSDSSGSHSSATNDQPRDTSNFKQSTSQELKHQVLTAPEFAAVVDSLAETVLAMGATKEQRGGLSRTEFRRIFMLEMLEYITKLTPQAVTNGVAAKILTEGETLNPDHPTAAFIKQATDRLGWRPAPPQPGNGSGMQAGAMHAGHMHGGHRPADIRKNWRTFSPHDAASAAEQMASMSLQHQAQPRAAGGAASSVAGGSAASAGSGSHLVQPSPSSPSEDSNGEVMAVANAPSPRSSDRSAVAGQAGMGYGQDSWQGPGAGRGMRSRGGSVVSSQASVRPQGPRRMGGHMGSPGMDVHGRWIGPPPGHPQPTGYPHGQYEAGMPQGMEVGRTDAYGEQEYGVRSNLYLPPAARPHGYGTGGQRMQPPMQPPLPPGAPSGPQGQTQPQQQQPMFFVLTPGAGSSTGPMRDSVSPGPRSSSSTLGSTPIQVGQQGVQPGPQQQYMYSGGHYSNGPMMQVQPMAMMQGSMQGQHMLVAMPVPGQGSSGPPSVAPSSGARSADSSGHSVIGQAMGIGLSGPEGQMSLSAPAGPLYGVQQHGYGAPSPPQGMHVRMPGMPGQSPPAYQPRPYPFYQSQDGPWGPMAYHPDGQ